VSALVYKHVIDGRFLMESIAAARGALFAADVEAAVAFLSTPQRFVIARVLPDGALYGPQRSSIDVEAAYEARVFSLAAELRWMRNGRRLRAAIVSDHRYREGLEAVECLATRPHSYLVYGAGVSACDGADREWSLLSDPRIGRIAVPVPGVPQDGRVVLIEKEYWVARADEYGNVVPALRRFVAMQRDMRGNI
jgi:CRISPR-associated protein (TIGR03984 family)